MDLGKVTVFSGSPQQQSSPTPLYLQLVLQLDDMAVLSGDAHGHESPRPPHTALSRQREEISMSRRGRAASEGRGRRCNRATGNRRFKRSSTSTRAHSR